MTLKLDTGWRLRDETGAHEFEANLPFDVVSSLYDCGAIPDPYWGRNAEGLRWIAERKWTATRSFSLTDTADELVLSGLDGVVDVLINGQSVLTTENAFRTWRVNLFEVANEGENEITLRFRSVIEEAAKRQAAQPFIQPYAEMNCPIPNINMLRKQQCDFGWDWNCALAPFGVAGMIQIEPAGAPRITHINVDQEHHDIESESVSLTVVADLSNVPDGSEVKMQFADRERIAVAENNRAEAKFFVEVPEFWWPAGQGAQTLYDLSVEVVGRRVTRRIGLRRIEHVTHVDDHGRGFKFRVNGRDVYAKGAAWIPADALSGRIRQDHVRALLQSAVDANMNMIRVWGGGRYEPDWFYDLCDELGLMVWQDFMFACAMYPADPAFLENVGEEVREQVRRLSHHACLALWCGDNEIIGMLEELPEARKHRDRYLVQYDRLNRHVEAVLKAEDQNANWWPSSPSLGPLDFGDAWHRDSSGDMHVWSVWHENKPFETYRDLTPRFVSEFGFQSYPSLDVIASFAEPKDFNIAAPVMESHQKNAGGNERIAATLMREFRFPEGFGNFVYLSQIQQGLALKTAVSAWRAQKGHNWGVLYWQLNDTWPCASWSTLNYGGGWKLSHHMAQRFYAPVFVAVVPEADTYVFKVMNDLPENVEVSVQVAAVNMSGEARPLADAVISAWPSKALELFELPKEALQEDEIFVYTWQYDGGASGDFFAPKPWKSYDMIDPEITVEVTRDAGKYEIVLTSTALAPFVALEATVAGHFSANAIMLLPGMPATITFEPKELNAKAEFTLRDLYSATYGGTQ
ncbi:beta-mannosidase [Celeribacter litoreus]|uniref:beta-mannosidase n=1 Tax=Celeribacter litoreus TaxID=2876714 RepID=UPI001CC9856C|nr:glycoside hydrolase family 2 protein [Celeribacter litoreus]MCA0043643.1 glycoside hydrolase family 2 protein [Celeribacter litoreus]